MVKRSVRALGRPFKHLMSIERKAGYIRFNYGFERVTYSRQSQCDCKEYGNDQYDWNIRRASHITVDSGPDRETNEKPMQQEHIECASSKVRQSGSQGRYPSQEQCCRCDFQQVDTHPEDTGIPFVVTQFGVRHAAE